MEWSLEEALEHYRRQGAPGNQMALISLLKELQQENGGAIPPELAARVAQAYGTKEALVLALIRRIPSLRLQNTHCLELCGGDGCRKRADLLAFVRRTYGDRPQGFTLRLTGCMHNCGNGPNIRWDGVLYPKADEALIRKLVGGAGK